MAWGVLVLSLFGSTASAQSYCSSDGGSGNTFNIDRVAFATLDNTTGDNNGYGDFTALAAAVDPGSTYSITMEPNGPYFLRYRWRVWIDWDQDGTFSLNERVVQRTGYGNETATITVPAGALPGNTRMRVNMSAFAYRDACENWLVGEVEDYTVAVSESCVAKAGTLTITKPLVCFEGSSANLAASVDVEPTVPPGYQVLYVLTSGSGLVIEQVNADPAFTVTEPGLYTIHTLVYDPNTLDLSIVVPGQTTGGQVNSLLIQGGGSICAALDVTGAAFNVTAPSAGTLSGGGDVCLSGDAVTLTATPNGDSNTPDGYSLAYVLTSGSDLVIQQLGGSPEFQVMMGGLYTIHTFVFPSDLDLSVVEPGVTTGGDVLGLLAANNICASLDVTGAAFNVVSCDDECLADAGTLFPADFLVCWQDEPLIGVPAGNATVPDGYEVLYVLTRGNGLVIRQVNSEPVFTVNQNGIYRIHTLVYDPSTLDLSIVQFGTTTGFDVNSLLIQGGGPVCGSLDVQGAPYIAVGPVICAFLDIFRDIDTSDPQAMQDTLDRMEAGVALAIENDSPVNITGAWPNPTRDLLNLDLYVLGDQNLSISILDLSGKEVLAPRAAPIGAGSSLTALNVSGLSSGTYLLRIVSSDHAVSQRFVKVD
ncbi:MAG TPA: GEVED domain-containing protein [Flavobacteriales bacterium]|nr:GEVED domain-containing protein [Flavobacteriales bacterium]